MLTFEPPQFKRLLEGQTKPALFVVEDTRWVFRYRQGDGRQLRLASEYLGYCVASWLDVPVPAFRLAQTLEPIPSDQIGVRIPVGIGTATRWIDDIRYPDLEHSPLEPFWEEELYLGTTASLRVADTWIMNYDRRKVGNVGVRGDSAAPEVYFLDFDQAFLAKYAAKPGGDRPHWIASEFAAEMLNDRELLSGFDGSGMVKSQAAQHHGHFDQAVQRLRSVASGDVEQAIRSIPHEWGLGESDRCVWGARLLARREIVFDILKAYGFSDSS